MPVLPYCIVLANEEAEHPLTGVRGARVQSLLVGGLRVFYSTAEEPVLSPATLKADALDFSKVVRPIFARRAVVPFRFPALVIDEERLREHVRDQSQQYKDFLERTRDLVQMEVSIKPREAAMAQESSHNQSGTAYLREKQGRFRESEEQIRSIREKVNDLVKEWREKESPRGPRLYALVPRTQIKEFRERLSTSEFLVTGPWPAFEFLTEDPRSKQISTT